MICKDCKSTAVKTRRNYSHGSKSKAKISLVCKKCGSTNIESKRPDSRKGKFKRR
ncbi:MAG: hypothetical protein KJ939_07315 [Nanoarchaeota archaeon]|nr:hypothetical protein [Nanoarchaeota archaeon]